MLPRGDEMTMGRVTKRDCESDGNPLVTSQENPIIDTRQYIVELNDGDEAELAANVIANKMYTQCDPGENQYVLLDSLIDFCRSTTALYYDDQKVTANDRTHYRCSTAVWQMCCQWKDGSTSWCKLSDLKESHPIETAEYAVAQGLDGETAFNWWVPHVIKKRAHIISLVEKRSVRYLNKTHKFGFQVTKSAKHALELDKTER